MVMNDSSGQTVKCQHERTGLLFSAFRDSPETGEKQGKCFYCGEWFDLKDVQMPKMEVGV